MEPSGRNQWQPVANATAAKTPNQAKSVAMGCDPLPLNLDGKEGVDGSSPSEGSAKAPHTGAFGFGLTCRVGSVRSPYPFVGQGWTTAMPYGLLPVAMVAVALRVPRSITDSVLAPWLAT
jgi:hypothetical protein